MLLKIVNLLSLSLYPARYRPRFCNNPASVSRTDSIALSNPSDKSLATFTSSATADDMRAYFLGKATRRKKARLADSA